MNKGFVYTIRVLQHYLLFTRDFHIFTYLYVQSQFAPYGQQCMRFSTIRPRTVHPRRPDGSIIVRGGAAACATSRAAQSGVIA